MFELFLWVLFLKPLYGGVIEKVQDTKVIFVNDEGLQVGEKVFVFSKDGKKIGLLEVKKITKSKALGQILKGKAQVGLYVGKRFKSLEINRNRWGIFIGLAQNFLKTPNDQLKGNSTFLGALMSIDLGSSLFLHLSTSYLPFEVKGSTGYGKFQYLDLSGRLGFLFLSNAWVGAGGSFLLNLSSRYQIPGVTASNRISNMFFLGAGYDFYLSSGGFHFIVDYNIFPSSASIQANMLTFKLAYSRGF